MENQQTETNLSAVLFKKNNLQLVEWPLPPPLEPHEVLLKTICVGICGSDVAYWNYGHIGHFVLESPMILGHETCAEVVNVGTQVNNLWPGDRVAIEPGISCRKCVHCKQGRYNLCTEMIFHATPPYNGTLTKYFKHPGDLCFRLPDHVTNEEGALLEPLSVGVHACKRAQVAFGSKVLICGSGPIGLVCAMAAKAFGAEMVCITDINVDRLKIAKEVVADKTVLIGKIDTTESLVEVVEKQMDGLPDVTIECSGAESSMKLALLATKPGGKVVLVGHGKCHENTLPIIGAAIKEVDVFGSFRYMNTWPLALSMVANKKINLKSIITHHFMFKDTIKAFETVNNEEGIKVMIQVRDG